MRRPLRRVSIRDKMKQILLTLIQYAATAAAIAAVAAAPQPMRHRISGGLCVVVVLLF